MSPLLDLDALDARYGDFQALFGIELAVEEGETFAVIGANGAGKSTMLNTIAGLVPVAGGHVVFDGSTIDRDSVHQRVSAGIALVPEGRRVFPSLGVEENLLIGGYRKRKGWWTVERVYELFPLLEPLARRSATGLSGGEQQMLAIGRALMANPRLLLLDELSLGLAPIVVQHLYETLNRITAEGTTLVIVEQDITQALEVADRFVCLLEGRVSLTGRPADVEREQITGAYFGAVRS
jgi:branched-chain amino acid transport system ATP-binding protein